MTIFHLRIYDNFHSMDESEAYDYGHYFSYEEAVRAAKAIVDDFFEHNWKMGMTSEELLTQYALYGEDPVVLPNESGEHGSFSASNYAEISAVEICRKRKGK